MKGFEFYIWCFSLKCASGEKERNENKEKLKEKPSQDVSKDVKFIDVS